MSTPYVDPFEYEILYALHQEPEQTEAEIYENLCLLDDRMHPTAVKIALLHLVERGVLIYFEEAYVLSQSALRFVCFTAEFS